MGRRDSTNAVFRPLSLRASARLAPTIPPPIITTSNFIEGLYRCVAFVVIPLSCFTKLEIDTKRPGENFARKRIYTSDLEFHFSR